VNSVGTVGCAGQPLKDIFSFVENLSRNMAGFRHRITRERKKRGWSQAEVARKLKAKDIDNVHISTVSKIEAGDREIKLDEALAIAEIYGLSLDVLLGRKPQGQRNLRYLLDALTDAVFLSRTELQRTAKTLHDRLEDIPPDYAGYDTLAGHVRAVTDHLDAAGRALEGLVDESIKDIVPRAVERLKRMSPQEREQFSKTLPRANKDATR
jgi:transcriptional regulator with XRE-family HTH domain